jgi:hypothetical protein
MQIRRYSLRGELSIWLLTVINSLISTKPSAQILCPAYASPTESRI